MTRRPRWGGLRLAAPVLALSVLLAAPFLPMSSVHPELAERLGNFSAPASPGIPGIGSAEAVNATLQRLGPENTPFLNWSTGAVGNLSSGVVAVDAGNSTMYSANTLAGTVTSVNVTTGARIASADVERFDPGRWPLSIFYDGIEQILIVGMGVAWPAPPVQGQLLALNPLTLRYVELFNDSGIPGFTPVAFAYDPPTHRFFVANATDGYVGVFNATTLYSVADLRVPGAPQSPGAGLADTPEGLVWQTDGTSSIFRIDPHTASYMGTAVNLTGRPFPAGPIVVVPANSSSPADPPVVWVGSTYGPYLEGFNASTGVLVGNATADGKVTALGTVPGLRLFLAGATTPTSTHFTVQAFDAGNGTALSSYPLTLPLSVPGGPSISSIAWAQTGTDRIVLGGFGAGAYRELNVSAPPAAPSVTLTEVRNYSMAPSVQEASAWDPGSQSFLVADVDPDQLVAYDGSTGAVRWTTPLGAEPFTDLALNPDNGEVCLGLAGGAFVVLAASNGTPVGGFLTNSSTPLGLAVDPTDGWWFVINGSRHGGISVWNDSQGPGRYVGSLPDPSDENYTALLGNPSWNGIWIVGNNGPGTTIAQPWPAPSQGLQPATTLSVLDPLGNGWVNDTGWLFLPDPLDATVRVLSPSGASGLPWATGGLGFTSLVADPMAGVAFLGSNLTSVLGAFDLSTGQFLGVLEAGGTVSAAGFSLDPISGTLLDPLARTGAQGYFAQLTPPSAPTNLTLEGSNGTVGAHWDPPPQSLPAPILQYSLSATLGGSGTEPGVTLNTSAEYGNLTDLSDGSSYSVTVRAWNAAGESPPSLPGTAVPVGVPNPPSSPVEVGSSATTISLTWNPPGADGGSPVTNYTLRWAIASGGSWNSLDEPATSGTLRGLAPRTTYQVEVVASNAVGSGHPSAPALLATTTSSGGTLFGWPLEWVLVAGLVGAVFVVLGGYSALRRRGRERAERGSARKDSPIGTGPDDDPAPPA